MAVINWFKRAKVHDCILIDEVADGQPVTEWEKIQLSLDGDYFVDTHLGLGYTRERGVRPINLTDGKTTKPFYLIAKRAGAACGLVMLHNEIDQVIKIAGQTINMKTDELVLMLWTDPALNYNVQDNEGLKSMTKQNLLGFERLMLIFIGIILGWFIIGPAFNFFIGMVVSMVMRFLGN
jgi:hypothetical protein